MRKLLAMLAVLLLLPKLLIPAAEPLKATDLKKIPTAQLIQEIKDEYKIKGPQDCINWGSKAPTPEVNFDDQHQKACVVAGYRPVYASENVTNLSEKDFAESDVMDPKIRELISHPDSPVGYFFFVDKDGITRYLLYTKANDGERKAVLFALASMQKNVRSWYLTGTLLGYPPDAVRFFYQMSSFLETLPEQPTTHNYENWSLDLKKQFEEFKQLKDYKVALADYKKQAEKWLADKKIKKIIP